MNGNPHHKFVVSVTRLSLGRYILSRRFGRTRPSLGTYLVPYHLRSSGIYEVGKTKCAFGGYNRPENQFE